MAAAVASSVSPHLDKELADRSFKNYADKSKTYYERVASAKVPEKPAQELQIECASLSLVSCCLLIVTSE